MNILRGKLNQIDDLNSLDSQLYSSLINLKDFVAKGGDVESLGLNFEVERYSFGSLESVELIPGGSNIPVTNANLITYIHRLADYKLNKEIREQCSAFLSGFRTLIQLDWIRMFSPRELQLLISGDHKRLDINDLRRNVHYAGGYHDKHPYIESLWSLIDSWPREDQCDFLKFVTSCPRQPLLGFGQLSPKFGILKVPTYEDNETVARLPSAATCMNLLKLPQYDNVDVLNEKLLYAIRSNSGFELS